ncbi:MAG TPA: uracil-DNA glycosylase [Jatrophihabitantaceae bacterium]|jgi:uracil-DNA glycosylase family 4|nr:uracil-DNA glycosylase [Jatrophihabitantaceae bacterium]
MVARPGSGWPGDLATVRTPIAHDADEVTELAESAPSLGELSARSTVCRACPRLVSWRELVAVDKRRAFADQEYWGRPVASFGVDEPRIIVVGLAPAAHGANRTGRMFTGDRSGDWLYASLHRVGLANQPSSVDADDGLALRGVRLMAPVRCAPPANKPTPRERDTCRGWFDRELAMLWPGIRVVVVLGAFGWQALWPVLQRVDADVPARLPRFAHGAEVGVGSRTVLGCYHVSQQNTFTGRLTEPMLDAVFHRAADLAGRVEY